MTSKCLREDIVSKITYVNSDFQYNSAIRHTKDKLATEAQLKFPC